MKLDGLHHLTMITADAPENVRFYGDVLGLRLVKKTVNFDAPDAYHLYFGDERGAPGSLLTWFEFTDAARGTAGAGMIHTIRLGVRDEAALDFWEERLAASGHAAERGERVLRFADPDGLGLELVIADADNPPLRAQHPEIPAEHAIVGVEGARAYDAGAGAARAPLLTDTLGFAATGPDEYVLEGPTRRFRWAYDHSDTPGRLGAGTVHHIAWHSADADHEAWRERAVAAGMAVTPIIDRDYFMSIYFREPEGVLFEIATTSPGFAVDEDPEHLGESLELPAQHEHLRPQLEQLLRPIENPRAARRAGSGR